MARSRDTRGASSELNLVPIMNLIVCLIPVVLAGTSLLEVGVIDVQAPRFCASGCGDAPETAPLNLTVAVGADGFRLAATGGEIDDVLAREAAPGPHIALTAAGAPDYPKLYSALAAVKAQYPQEFSFTLAADADVPYAQIVRVMDVARVQLEGRDFADADALRAAEVRRDAAGRATPLLPDVVLATAR